MSGSIPEVYWAEWHGKIGFACGRCGQGITRPELGDSLADLTKIIRAHQRSEVCA